MTFAIDAIYDQGVFRPVQPLNIPDGSRVHLRVEEPRADEKTMTGEVEEELPTLLDRMKGFVGTVHDLPSDASVNLNHYLYGTPKRQ